jgi:undecaprenyl-diphosphatase
MEIWQAIVLGAVQGFAEFLPISSSGHLILLQNWFGITDNVVFYSIMLHIGTLIPVIVVLWKEIIGLFKKPFSNLGLLVLASIPAGVIGIVMSVAFDLDAVFTKHYYLLAITFLLTATELIFAERIAKKKQMNNGINVKTSFIMGAGQALGVIPGLSRSGTTISAGCLARVDKEKNANFTFLMSIPIIVAAAGMELIGGIKDGTLVAVDFLPLIIGMVTAMVCGYIAIKFMLKIIKKANYKWFSVYLVGIAIATVITYLV